MISPPTMAPGIELNPPRIRTGQGLEGDERQAKLHAQPCAPEHASDQGHDAGGGPGNAPDVVQRNPHRQGRLVVVRDGSQGPPDTRLVRKTG